MGGLDLDAIESAGRRMRMKLLCFLGLHRWSLPREEAIPAVGTLMIWECQRPGCWRLSWREPTTEDRVRRVLLGRQEGRKP